jgi:ubiquinone/menaquinone biosynthesis C-methylase UbiE
MDQAQIKRYWEQRAAADASAQSTTQDYYLREIECRVLHDIIAKYRPRRVLDVGCGDAWTTVSLASAFPDIEFVGGDYSGSMIRNAETNIRKAGLTNIRVSSHDATQAIRGATFDLIYTTRCLINLPTPELQQRGIRNIYDALDEPGIYVMIENFKEGHQNFNQVRMAFGLPEIAVRSHNLLFERTSLIEFLRSMFELIEETNISSTYYLVSRIVYSRICKDMSVEPDYLDAHHRYASSLPFCGEFGPVRMLCLRKS